VARRRCAPADELPVTEPFQRATAKDPAEIFERELPVERPIGAGTGQREAQTAVKDQLDMLISLLDTGDGLPADQAIGMFSRTVDLAIDVDERETIDVTEVEIMQWSNHAAC
jgi:hypothetical protein